jgi:hydrogenase expression/formation protein HypC
MCLAIPAKVKRKSKNIAEIESFGVFKKVDISLIPEVKVGDFVIVHAGFAIQIIDKEDALIAEGYWKDYLGQENLYIDDDLDK